MFHILATGEDFYEGFNLFAGLEALREPLLREPPELPERPSALEDDLMWNLVTECLSLDPGKRPSFSILSGSLNAHIANGESGPATTQWLTNG